MKKIRVISLIEREQIKIDASPLQLVEEGKLYFKDYYHIAGNLIEFYDFSNEKLVNEENWVFSYADQTIILMDTWNNRIDVLIKTYFQDSIIMTRNYSSIPSYFKTVIELLDQSVDLDLLVWFLEDNSLQLPLKNGHSLLIGKEGEEGIVAHIILNTLNQISHVQVCKHLQLYLFSKERLSLSDLALIKDPIHEYIDYKQFKIEQSAHQYLPHSICYALLFDQ